MNSNFKDNIVDDWIAFHQLSQDGQDGSTLRFVEHEVSRLARTEPARCMQVVAEVFKRDRSDRVVQGLASGPLEELFLEHGEKAILLFELHSGTTPDLDTVLGGVWDDDFTPEVKAWLAGRRRSRW